MRTGEEVDGGEEDGEERSERDTENITLEFLQEKIDVGESGHVGDFVVGEGENRD